MPDLKCIDCRYDNCGTNRKMRFSSSCLHPREDAPGFYDEPIECCFTPREPVENLEMMTV